MSDFHPEKWNPCWTAGSIINGLCSFMLEEYGSPVGYTGSLADSSQRRKELAQQSGSHNIKHFPKFNEHFPGEVYIFYRRKLPNKPFDNFFFQIWSLKSQKNHHQSNLNRFALSFYWYRISNCISVRKKCINACSVSILTVTNITNQSLTCQPCHQHPSPQQKIKEI